MTKASKALTVALAAFSIIFMGVAAVMSTVRTDWREKATKEFPKSRITEQVEKIKELDEKIGSFETHQKEAAAAIEADVKSLFDPAVGREAQLEAQLAKLVEESNTLTAQIETDAKKVQLKQDEDKRLREEVTRLRAQYDDLVSQKYDVVETVKRQRDLLFQAKGVLERVQHRLELLKATAGKEVQYAPDPTGKEEEAKPDSQPAAAGPSKTLK